MGRIQLLDTWVAERIHAGEVIERPASVVKELIENSLDAGARHVSIRLADGGKRLIEITDDGCGMDPDDLTLCLERHATSKVATLEDLAHLRTLGFRGEALPSIASVAEVELLSRTRDGDHDARPGDSRAYVIRRGTSSPIPHLHASSPPEVITYGDFFGSKSGTRIQVRELFGSVPVRLKFLRSAGTETAHIRDLLERLSLSRPDVSFHLASEEKGILFQAPSESLEERVRRILADQQDHPIVHQELRLGGHDGLSGILCMHWVQGLSLPRAQSMVQLLNGRVIRDRLIHHAITQGFKQAFLPGQFPAILVSVEMDPELFDVNVHPTKQEIKFQNASPLLAAIHQGLGRLLAQEGQSTFVPRATPHTHVSPRVLSTSVTPTLFAPQFLTASGSSEVADPEAETTRSVAPSLLQRLADARPAGSLFATYLLWEYRGNLLEDRAGTPTSSLLLMDQHAAHERVRFEQLEKSYARLWSGNGIDLPLQQLLVPEVLPIKQAPVSAVLAWLELLGLDADLFGERSVLIRGTPSFWGQEDVAGRLHSLLARVEERCLRMPDSPDLSRTDLVSDLISDLLTDHALFEAMASRACRSSRRAGDVLSPQEHLALREQLLQCRHPWNCPHGRPVLVEMPETRFEEWFQRIAPATQGALG